MEHHHDPPKDPDNRLDALERQVAGQARSDRYAFFYGPLAVASVALPFTPIFEDVVEGEGLSVTTYGSVWDMAGDPSGGPAVVALLLVGVLVALLVTTVVRPRSARQPAGIAIAAGLIAIMLITKPGTGDPAPDLSPSGLAGLVLVICLVGLVASHAVQLARAGRAERPAPDSQPERGNRAERPARPQRGERPGRGPR